MPELFATPPDQVRDWIRGPYRSAWGRVFKHLDRALRWVEPLFPATLRASAFAKAEAFVSERLNGEDGLGGVEAGPVLFFFGPGVFFGFFSGRFLMSFSGVFERFLWRFTRVCSDWRTEERKQKRVRLGSE